MLPEEARAAKHKYSAPVSPLSSMTAASRSSQQRRRRKTSRMSDVARSG